MYIGAAITTPIAAGATGTAAPRVQPVGAIVRYPSAGAHNTGPGGQETALEGEFLRGDASGRGHGATVRQVYPGALANAAHAVSLYAYVSASTDPQGTRDRRRLDLSA